MAMMHVCISPESILGSKHVYRYTWLSCQKPCLTLVYYSERYLADGLPSTYLFIYCFTDTHAKIVGHKIDRIIYETNVTAIYGGMICQLAVKLHVTFDEYVFVTMYKNYYYSLSHRYSWQVNNEKIVSGGFKNSLMFYPHDLYIQGIEITTLIYS